jgi:hypothetical protein
MSYLDVSSMSYQQQFDLLTTTRERIRSTARVNFKGQPYIKSECLRQLFSMNLVYDLLYHSEEQKRCWPALDNAEFQDEIDKVKNSALCLLGLCLLANISVNTFIALYRHGICDENFPLSDETLRFWTQATERESLLEYQSHFIPYQFSDDGTHHNVPYNMPLPIVFEELDDRVGQGSFSEVYRVQVDSDVKPFCEVYFGNPIKFSAALTSCAISVLYVPSSASNRSMRHRPFSFTNAQC